MQANVKKSRRMPGACLLKCFSCRLSACIRHGPRCTVALPAINLAGIMLASRHLRICSLSQPRKQLAPKARFHCMDYSLLFIVLMARLRNQPSGYHASAQLRQLHSREIRRAEKET